MYRMANQKTSLQTKIKIMPQKELRLVKKMHLVCKSNLQLPSSEVVTVLERVHPLKDSSRVRAIWDCDSSRVHLKMLESSPSPPNSSQSPGG